MCWYLFLLVLYHDNGGIFQFVKLYLYGDEMGENIVIIKRKY